MRFRKGDYVRLRQNNIDVIVLILQFYNGRKYFPYKCKVIKSDGGLSRQSESIDYWNIVEEDSTLLTKEEVMVECL